MTEAPTYRWIESTSWELPFFGLPYRIPWPEDVAPEVANTDPFEVEHLLRAIEAIGPEAGEPWTGFLNASKVLEDLSESLEDQEIARAHSLLEEYERRHPGTGFALYHFGMVARMEGREEDALKHFRDAAEKSPRVAPVWNNIGILLAMRGEREPAIEAFKKVLELTPGDRTALEGLAQMRYLVKLRRDPNDPNSIVFVDVPRFRQIVGQQLQQIADDPDKLLAQGDQLLRDGLIPDVGFQALQRALQLRPEHPHTLLAVTAALRLGGHLEQALQTITRFTELYPQDAVGYFHLAQIHNAMGNAEAEKAALDKVLELDPNVQPALGIRFELSPDEHDPAKEEALTKFAEERKSWMSYLLASDLARRRADAKSALKWAEKAHELNPDAEEVVLHLTAVIGDARDFAKLASTIKPKLDTGKFSKRLDWNYAQVLQQLGLANDALTVLRKAASAADAPEGFKDQAQVLIDAWSGFLSGCGVPLEVHQSGFLIRPVQVALPEGDGGVVLNAGAPLPAAGSFPWRAEGPETRVSLQQGQDESKVQPRSLGTFLVKEIQLKPTGNTTIDCHVVAQPDGRLHFRATQDGRKLRVTWSPAGIS